jgi:uncharacterized protein (DUF302 family)
MTSLVSGLTTLPCSFSPEETSARFEVEIKARGMTVFARINHSALAAEVGMILRPTEVIIFGHPRGGTPLMQISQTLGIDLPLKALVWQDATGKTWLSYNQPEWLASRHGAEESDALAALSQVMASVAARAAREQ